MNKVTREQARKLLEDATPGPWEISAGYEGLDEPTRVVYDTVLEDDFIRSTLLATVERDADARLLLFSRALAETVIWLREQIESIHNDQRNWADAYRAPVPDDPWSILPDRAARAEAHDDCADMLQTLLDDEITQDEEENKK